jgi:hypothetical protein
MSGIVEPTDWPEELSPKQKAFLEGFSRTGTVLRACKDVCHRITHYKWLRESEQYRRSFDDARALFGEHLREVAIDRALVGVEEPVIRRGSVLRDENGNVVTRRQFDRALLKALIQWASKPWDEQLRNYFSGSNATQGYTSAHTTSKTAKRAGPTIGGAPGEPVKIGKRMGYAID